MACNKPAQQKNAPAATPAVEVVIAGHFSYPIGESETVTKKKDEDPWYNQLEFGQDDNLGEDWALNTGGNSACGQPVYAVANGIVTYSDFAGPEWGLVTIIDHVLPSGEKVQSLYGNLFDASIKEGPVKERQQIGKVGNANGRYLCRLHFEIRTSDSPSWGEPGPGTSSDKKGWVDPSDFIDSHR